MQKRRRPTFRGQPLRRPGACGHQLAQQIVVRVALFRLRSAVDDDRLTQVPGELEVAAQIAQLIVARRKSAVVVETRLADRDGGWVARELGDCRKVSIAV